jgi:hypothetical protein
MAPVKPAISRQIHEFSSQVMSECPAHVFLKSVTGRRVIFIEPGLDHFKGRSRQGSAFPEPIEPGDGQVAQALGIARYIFDRTTDPGTFVFLPQLDAHHADSVTPAKADPMTKANQ